MFHPCDAFSNFLDSRWIPNFSVSPKGESKHRGSPGGVSPDDVISSPGGDPLEATFLCPPGCPSGIGERYSHPWRVPTVNLQPSTYSGWPGATATPSAFGRCPLAPPRLAFEYNTWPSPDERPRQPKRTVIMLMRGHCCVHPGRPAECRISFFPSLERPLLSPTPPLWREKPRRLFVASLMRFAETGQ